MQTEGDEAAVVVGGAMAVDSDERAEDAEDVAMAADSAEPAQSEPVLNEPVLNEPVQAGATEAEEAAASPERSSSPASSEPQLTCIICGKPASCTCPLCQAENYCGRDCQVQAWTAHRKQCNKVPKDSAPSSKPATGDS